MPAAAAMLAAGGAPRIGRASGSPYMKSPAYTSTAKTKLNSGPAMTMAKRFHTLCRLKARASSAGSTGPSRSSSIFTYPPNGIAAMTHSVRTEAPERERPAEPDREAQHLYPAESRDQVMAVLMHRDQHAERDDECDDGLHEAHAATASTHAAALRRAASSAAITAARPLASP